MLFVRVFWPADIETSIITPGGRCIEEVQLFIVSPNVFFLGEIKEN